jgi:hypothetical protein
MSRISGSSYDSRLMSRSGDGSTLSLDFTAMGGVLDPRITFSRADATARATFINSLGYVETVPSGQPQAPRFTFSETSIGTPRGLLLEAPATNLLHYSQNADPANSPFNIWWVAAAGATVSSTTQTDPSNQSSASRCVLGTSTVGRVYNVQTTTAGTTYTFSFYAKSISGTTALYIWHFSSATGNFTAQTITTEWKRYSITILGRAGGGFLELGISNLSASAATVDIWGFQLETGSQASSYIRTPAAASVTRAVDTAIIAAGSNFSSWYTGGTTGTFVTEWCRCSPTTTQRTVIATSDVSNQHLHQYIAATTSRLRLADKVPAFIETANASVDNSINKGAFSYAGSVQSLCLNGGTVVPGTLAFSVAPTFLSIGGPSTNGTSITDTAVVLNNAIRKIKYFPTRLSDGQIQGLST